MAPIDSSNSKPRTVATTGDASRNRRPVPLTRPSIARFVDAISDSRRNLASRVFRERYEHRPRAVVLPATTNSDRSSDASAVVPGAAANYEGTFYPLSVFRDLGEDAIADELFGRLVRSAGENVPPQAGPLFRATRSCATGRGHARSC